MKTIYFTRKNPVSHYALVSAVKPTGFEGTFPDYPDGTVFVEVELEDVEPVIGKTLIYGDVVEGECTDELFEKCLIKIHDHGKCRKTRAVHSQMGVRHNRQEAHRRAVV